MDTKMKTPLIIYKNSAKGKMKHKVFLTDSQNDKIPASTIAVGEIIG